jgi:hypothetical protein
MSKATSSKYVNLIGYSKKTGIVGIKDTICFRKPLDIDSTKKIMSKYKNAIGMVSSHNIYRKPNTPYCKCWCSCFRGSDKYFPSKPVLMLSESDFVDEKAIRVFSRSDFKWDFFYFTIGGELGNIYKGFNVFIESLPVMCGKFNLKGIMIRYARTKAPLSKHHKKMIRKYNIKVLNKKIPAERVASIMARSRFGFFPNIQDCSPMLLGEALVRNCPVLVNENILGGWKYVNERTGEFFNKDNICQQTEKILRGEYCPTEYFKSHYGYLNTSKLMANFVGQFVKSCRNMEMLALAPSKKTMEQYV